MDRTANSESVNQEEIIDLRQYWQTITKYKWRIITLAIVVSALAAVITFSMTPIYRATATMLIETEQAKAVSIQEVYGIDSSNKEYLLTQFEILKSNNLAEKVIDKLDLANNRHFNPPAKKGWLASIKSEIKGLIGALSPQPPVLPSVTEKTAQQKRKLIEKFRSSLTISPVRKTQLVHISFDSTSPQLAATIVNTLGSVYVDSHLDAKMSMTQNAAQWLNVRVAEVQQKLQQSEQQLQEFLETEQLIDSDGLNGLAAGELKELTNNLLEARSHRSQLESIYQQIEQAGSTDFNKLASMQEILNQKVIADVKKSEVAAQQKVAELSKRYGSRHLKMIAARAELDAIQTNLNNQIRQLVTGLRQEVAAATENEKMIELQFNEVKARYQQTSRKTMQYQSLQRQVSTNRDLYDTLLVRFKETDVAGDFNSAHARFTDQAAPPLKPIKPKKGLIIALAFVATLMLGIMLAFVMEALNDTFKSPQDLEQHLAQRMLGLLPLIQKKSDQRLATATFFDPEQRAFAESVRTLRTSFILSHLDKPAPVVAVTSSVPGEGKTTTALNLAFAMAQMEDVLLIDADLRRPSLGKEFDIPPYQPGLSDLIAGSATLKECLHVDPQSKVVILPAGHVPPNPLELLASNQFKELLANLGKQYSRIVIDTPPTQAVSDSLVISQQVDAMIYVVKAECTRQKVAQQSLGRLLQIGARIDGVVLNQVDVRKSKSGGYYGYDGYAGYYDSEGYGAASGPSPASNEADVAEITPSRAS